MKKPLTVIASEAKQSLIAVLCIFLIKLVPMLCVGTIIAIFCVATFSTTALAKERVYIKDALTGGTSTSLDGISVSDLAKYSRAVAFVYDTNDRSYIFEFQAGATDSENTSTHPYRIRPDDYSSQGVWYEQTIPVLQWVGVVDVLHEYGASVNQNSTTLQAALTAVGTSYDVAFWMAPGTWTITSGVTIPSNIVLVMPFGAELIMSSGVTLTAYSPEHIIASPRQQIVASTRGLAFTNSGTVYPEWWGVDGTADEVQINAALTAASHVKLQSDTTYDINDDINAVSNRSLIANDWTTILQQTDTAAGNKHAIHIAGVTNFKASGFKIDGNSATVGGNGIPIEIDGHSSFIYLSDIMIEDSGGPGLRIRPDDTETITDIYIDRLSVTNPGTRFVDVTCGTTGTTNIIKRVYFDKLYTYNSVGAGITVNANRTSVGLDDNELQGVYFNDVVIDTTVSYGFAVSAKAEDVHISNFFITDTTDDAIRIETTKNWSVKNGQIASSGADGIRTTHTDTAHNFDGWYGGTIDNVEISGSTEKGIVLYGSAATYWSQGISITNCKIHDNTSIGVLCYYTQDVILANNDIYSNGSHGINVYGSDNDHLTIHGNLIHDNTSNGLMVASNTTCNDIRVKNNQIWDNGTDIHLTLPVDLTAEQAIVHFGTIAGGTDDERPIFVADRGETDCFIIDVLVVNASDITQHDTDYETFDVQNKGADGSGTTSFFSTNPHTKATGGIDINAFEPISLGVDQNEELPPGHALTLKKTHSGGGQGTDEMKVIIKYIIH